MSSENFFNPKHSVNFRGAYMSPALIDVLKAHDISIMCRFCGINGQNILHMAVFGEPWPDDMMGSEELN